MFKTPFSFNGRIRRLEYGLSILICLAVIALITLIKSHITKNFVDALILLLLFPMIWFPVSQAAKRCHDIGCSGWLQIVPFFYLILIFKEGDQEENDYGYNPKQAMEVNYATKAAVDTVTIPDGGLSQVDE